MNMGLRRAVLFVYMLQTNRRIRVKTIRDQLGITIRSVYRLVREVSTLMPVRLESGVVINMDLEKVEKVEGASTKG